ncbi:histidine phosphatase family protein [Paenibacillus donghaensis]|uniref:Histidine phosphatase family protein n=1 Tax=Paenibacillus donghaensis TaxID=414771 RepID=A0A2Z2KLF3_9BACL|nr:histidine phosphatase family protein [Paenibacillus donghaensis]ASA19438.1 histidine phosphatase family protein [Paenibacillus donghaensis]
MKTYIYMVRHGDSPKGVGLEERTRELSTKGMADAHKVMDVLAQEGISYFYSSPYIRAVQTIEALAEAMGSSLVLEEDLREMRFMEGNRPLQHMFADPDFALTGGESARMWTERAVRVLRQILVNHRGERIAVGTHGAVMTLMMRYWDEQYGLDFVRQTSKPDIYKLEFREEQLLQVERIVLPAS